LHVYVALTPHALSTARRLLGQWFVEYRKDHSFGSKCPFMGWSAFELLAFGSYLASCRKPFSKA
jgi:hypothetical protein